MEGIYFSNCVLCVLTLANYVHFLTVPNANNLTTILGHCHAVWEP